MSNLFQMVILSGKGGVGKTNVVAALAYQAANAHQIPGTVVVDADVDAANMSLLLQPRLSQKEDFFGGKAAKIDPEICEGCGLCAEVCRYDAVLNTDLTYQIDEAACEGCAACYYVCPQQAIRMLPHQDGFWALSYTRLGPLLHAELFPGKDNSGKLVSLVRQQAKLTADQHRFPLILIDGPPGIGCPVIAASTGVDLGLIVTEPSVAAIHDLERIHQTLKHFQIPAVLCINKVGMYQPAYVELIDYAKQHDLPVLGKIPFDNAIPQAMVAGQVVQEYAPDSLAASAVRELWQALVPYTLERKTG
jgi:MinD superfamily P-loop ATPase